MVVAGDTAFFFIGCPLGSRGSHLNVKCFGDSTGMLKRVAHSGSPPYLYEWFQDGMLYSSGFNDTLFDNLITGHYEVKITDDNGCVKLDSANISSPNLLMLDTIFASDITLQGTNDGTISCVVSGGKTKNILFSFKKLSVST